MKLDFHLLLVIFILSIAFYSVVLELVKDNCSLKALLSPDPFDTPIGDKCAFDKIASSKGKDACHGDTACSSGECCDYKLDSKGKSTGECICHSNKNPCDTPEKCAACMAYAEAGGTSIPDDCMRLIICAATNRVNNPSFPPKASNLCEVVSQGNGQQFNSYKCVCNNQDPNQKYCKCCAGTLTGAELTESQTALSYANSPNCGGFTGNTFNNARMNSWAKQHCTKVSAPTCSNFDFYKC